MVFVFCVFGIVCWLLLYGFGRVVRWLSVNVISCFCRC